MNDLAGIFSTLSDPTRLRAMALVLEHDEICACGLGKVLELSRARINTLMRRLVESGLVQMRDDGECAYLRLAAHRALSSEQRIIVSMLRCMLPGQRASDLERRLVEFEAKRHRVGSRCLICSCKSNGGCSHGPKRAPAKPVKQRKKSR